MGDRYQLIQADLPEEASIGGQARFQIRLRNVGYAPLYNERHAYIVLSNQQSAFSIQLATDPRRWLPNGEETTIDESLTIPADVPTGTYQLYLHLPDAASSLAADPRYAVRFANVGVWDATTGMNSLNAKITVNGSSEDISNPTVDKRLSEKVLQNGHFYIRCGNRTYSVTGQEVK